MMYQRLDGFINTIAKKQRLVVKKDFDKHEIALKC
jgi:hypothetical protein